MPVYEYTALNTKGKTVSGVIDAESAIAVRQKLRISKVFPVSIKEVQDASVKKETSRFSFKRPFSRISLSEVSMMTRQLVTLVGAGFQLVSALDTLIPQTKSHTLKKLLTQIKDALVEGSSFAGAISQYPGIFSSLYVNMVHAGETSGTLEIVLERLADITEKQQALNIRIRSALAYPALMTVIGMIVLILLLTFIVPSITAIFTDMNQVLPTPTLILIAVSGLLKSYGWVLLIAIAAMIIVLRSIKKTARGQYLMDKALLSLPVIGLLYKKLAVARFSRTLGSLLENGVSMLPALEIVKNIVGNVLISNAIESTTKEVGKGQSLHQSLAASNVFPNLPLQMIQVGEQSGELEAMLTKVADVFENEVESTVLSMTSLLEPVMILIMGVIVGFIVLSICLPIFEMNQLVM
ncbi:type II secretion system inner membrane protein GspF [Thermodesulfobacteriota bacterium]